MHRRNVVLRLNSSDNSFMRRVLVQKNFVKITTGVGKLNTTERNHGHLRLSTPLTASKHPSSAAQLHTGAPPETDVGKGTVHRASSPASATRWVPELLLWFCPFSFRPRMVSRPQHQLYTDYDWCSSLWLTWVICKWSCAKKTKRSKDCRTNFKELLSGRRDGSEVKMERV